MQNGTSATTGFNGPVAEGERIATMDILRGFALLGIFLMNIEFFNRPLQDFSNGLPIAEGLDHVAGWLVYVFVQGKFWVLFSLLFGMGFAVMRDRAAAARRPFLGQYLRRTILLAAFGLTHIVLIWVGDVLFAYSLGALVLLAFMNVRGHALWVIGAMMYFGTAALLTLLGWALSFLPPEAAEPMAQQMAAFALEGQKASVIYAQSGFAEITEQRIADYFGFLFANAVIFQLPMMLGTFLIGTWLVRSGRIQRAAEHRRFFAVLGVIGVVFAAVFIAASLSVGTHFDATTGFAQSTVAMGLMVMGNMPLSLAYLSAIVLLCTLPSAAKGLSVLAPAGRMALTNYLSQSLICSLVFYGYGLGLFGELGRAAQVGFVFAVFAAQVAFSHFWLSRFGVGPLEALWRAGTYLQAPDWKPRTSAA
jgi:uncharacterized protein